MPQVRSFVGLQYDPRVAGPPSTLIAPPYDVISPWDQDRLYRASPYNVVRLILTREEPGDERSEDKYTRGAGHLRSWLQMGVLRPTEAPCIYPYEMDFHFGGRRRRTRGLIVEVEIEPWGDSVIPHERTMPGPFEDRLRLLRTVQANLSPVYAVFPGPSPQVSSFLEDVSSTRPQLELADEDGTQHRLWAVHDDVDPVTRAVARQPVMIADGHHRYSVALAYRQEMRARFGPGPWDWMMMLVVDAAVEDPPILPIHRVVSGEHSGPPAGERVRDLAEILATLSDERVTVGTVRRQDDGLVHEVHVLSGKPPTVCELHDQVLDGSEGVEIRFVPDAARAEAAVASATSSSPGSAVLEPVTAYLLPPTRVEVVWSVVASGRKLPPKSTYFWPKPRTGLVIRPIHPPG